MTSFFPQGSLRRKLLIRVLCKLIGPKETLPIQRTVQKTLAAPCEVIDPYAQRVEHFLTVSRYAGFPLAPGARILDYGCGTGALVHFLVERGYDAVGYDIRDYRDEKSYALDGRCTFFDQEARQEGYSIDWNKFFLPYPDNSFDAIFSHQVLEHVMGDGHEHIFQEFARVMKPGAASINLFPPRNVFLEPHILVPLGHRIHSKSYYYFMTKLGFRKHREGFNDRATVEKNYRYVRDCLNYLPNKSLVDIAHRYFHYARIDQGALF